MCCPESTQSLLEVGLAVPSDSPTLPTTRDRTGTPTVQGVVSGSTPFAPASNRRTTRGASAKSFNAMIASSVKQSSLAEGASPSSSKKKAKSKDISEPTELDEFGLTKVVSSRAQESIPILHSNARLLASQVVAVRETVEQVCTDLQTTVHRALDSIPAAVSAHLSEALPIANGHSSDTLQQILESLSSLQSLREDFRTLEHNQARAVALLHERIAANDKRHNLLDTTVASLQGQSFSMGPIDVPHAHIRPPSDDFPPAKRHKPSRGRGSQNISRVFSSPSTRTEVSRAVQAIRAITPLPPHLMPTVPPPVPARAPPILPNAPPREGNPGHLTDVLVGRLTWDSRMIRTQLLTVAKYIFERHTHFLEGMVNVTLDADPSYAVVTFKSRRLAAGFMNAWALREADYLPSVTVAM